MLHHLPFSREIRRNRQIRLNGREKLGAVLHYPGESLLDKAVQNFVNLLPRNVGARRDFKCLESRMSQHHQIRSCLVCIEPELLEPLPEALILDFSQILFHGLYLLTQSDSTGFCKFGEVNPIGKMNKRPFAVPVFVLGFG